MMAKITLVAM